MEDKIVETKEENLNSAEQASAQEAQESAPLAEEGKEKKKFFRTPKLFKSKLAVFILLTILTIIGGGLLFLLDDTNEFRNKLGIKEENIAWLRNIFHLDVNIVTWAIFALIVVSVFFIFFTVFFRKSIKASVENKREKKTGHKFTKKGNRLFDVFYWIIFAILVIAVGFGIAMMFSSVGDGFKKIFGAMGNGGLGTALLSFLASFGVLLLGILIIPITLLVLFLVFKLIVLFFGGLVGGIAKSVMASSNFQESYAAAQAASSKIKEEMGVTGGAGYGAGGGAGGSGDSKTTSTLGQTNYDGVLFPALDIIDKKYAAKAEEEAKAAEAAEQPVVEGEVVEAKPAAKETSKKKQDLTILIDEFQSYLVVEEKLYFSKTVLRTFVAGLSAARLLLLEGLSGTGKSSLPRKFQQFIGGKATFLQVQATWRDRTDIIGYFSDLTGYYKETELLKSIYESNYTPSEVNLIVLDEMNISRAEYYFADFLSIYEYPSSLWKVQLMQVSSNMQLPEKINGGAMQIPTNIWFIGTINVDDSTFTVTDKVYDRAIVIDFNAINEPFDATYDKKLEPITYEELAEFFDECQNNPKLCLTQEDKHTIFELLSFLDDTFEIKIGNRIFNQIEKFVPVFVGLGGKKLEALDMMISAKVFRKLDLVFIMDMADSLIKLQRFLHARYPKGSMPKCEAKINSLLRKYQ